MWRRYHPNMLSLGDPLSIARARIAEESEQRTGRLDLSDLDLLRLPDELLQLQHLRALDCSYTQVADLGPLAGLTALQQLDCRETPVVDLGPLAGLTALQQLNCESTPVADLGPLAGLTALQQLDCRGTPVADLGPLAGLTALQQLDCRSTPVADLGPLAGLTALQQLVCGFTPVADLGPLAGLTALQQLNCESTPVVDLGPLAGLTALQQLDCSGTPVVDLGPLAGLTALQQLVCRSTQVADLGPLAGLTALQQLVCWSTQVADLGPLAGLTALQQLDCSGTPVADLGPLAGLTALQQLDCSGCCLQSLQPVLDLPRLRELVLFEGEVAGLPAEILSDSEGANCLDSVRAHLADLGSEAVTIDEVRVLLIGNGRVGKTQIARWLAGEPFETAWNSTHGISVRTASLGDDGPTRLLIWDFGGQDIYHSTHALFLRTPAILVVVWAKAEEQLAAYDHDGHKFRNFPVRFWIDLVRHQADPRSPLLIVQTKCDRPEQEVAHPPVPQEALQGLGYAAPFSISVKVGYGLGTLREKLRRAVTMLRRDRPGDIRIGAGRLRVQRRLEALREADQALPTAERKHRLVERSDFERMCEEEGGVSSPLELLKYLDANGTVFYRQGLFGDRIVFDQSWAFEAIYAVFERTRAYATLRRLRGRFTRTDLANLVWQQHSPDDQDLLLSMMQSCGICFRHRTLEGPEGEEIEYIAPELLPERDEIGWSLASIWNEEGPTQEVDFRYGFLHEGLIRQVMSTIGETAGAEPVYWRGGLCGYELATRSRLLIEEERSPDEWHGQIRIRTQGGDMALLLEKAVRIVEQAQQKLGLVPERVARPTAPILHAETESLVHRRASELQMGQEKPARREWYVSYAWGDATPAGKEREKVVDDLCGAAAARGFEIIRDKNILSLGEKISRFMGRIGGGDRIFVILSDKYLRSSFCIYELSEIWRNSRHDPETLLERVRIYTLGDAEIWSLRGRAGYARYWDEEYKALEADQRYLGERDLIAHRRMKQFTLIVGDILATFADIVQPRSFDDLVKYGFDET
ncbi:MAG: COR domain-containing protein [Geminicoccaceae bacterium]